MLDTYVNWMNGADPTQYDWMNVENNLLPALYTFWLCEARPEWTDTCRLFLLEGQRKSFEYIKNSRDKGAYECMQRFTSYIMNSYIELDGGIPFRHYYEKFARSLFNKEFDLIRLPRCGNRFRRTRLQLQQKFCRYARRSPLQRRPYVQPGSRTALRQRTAPAADRNPDHRRPGTALPRGLRKECITRFVNCIIIHCFQDFLPSSHQ